MDPTEFRQRFADWKAGKKVYDAGRPITDDEYYSTMERVAKENWLKWGDSSEDAALTRILNANDYDYRGYYDKYPESLANADTHWTDEFKTVYHPTFSEESRYSGKKSKFNPEGLKGGSWGENDKFYPQNWLMFDTKHSNLKRPLPKYNGGTDDNPWIPKGTKVPTENSKETVVSMLPKTTYIGDGNQPESTKPVYHEPINPQTGRPYTVYEKDLPLSGTDPVGLAIVEGEALGPLFNGLGWLGGKALNFAMPYIGRAIKPVTNWFAAKALSNSIDDAIATPTFAKVLPTTELIIKAPNIRKTYDVDPSPSGPFWNKIYETNGVLDAMDYIESPERAALIDRLSKEAGFDLIVNRQGNFPKKISYLTDADADRILGNTTLGLHIGGNILVRESADPTTPFHEAIHAQYAGAMMYDDVVKDLIFNNMISASQKWNDALINGASPLEVAVAKQTYLAAKKEWDTFFYNASHTDDFLSKKAASALYDDASDYIKNPRELVAHGLQAGRKLGIKPFLEFPGYEAMRDIVKKARDAHSWMWDVKASSDEQLENFWNILTGNFLPSTVIGAGVYGSLQEHDNGKSIKPIKKRK